MGIFSGAPAPALRADAAGNAVEGASGSDSQAPRSPRVARESGAVATGPSFEQSPMSPTNGGGRSAGSGSLKDELQRLYSLRPTLDTFAEEATRLIISECNVTALAIFTYAQRKDELNALILSGFDDRSSGEVRATVGRAWDIPLRSIRNRRINVIVDAHSNPFVPEALKVISPHSLTIASVPFFHNGAPVGVAVFFATDPSAFSDAVLRAVSQGLRVCGAAITELPKTIVTASPQLEEAVAPESGEQPSLLRGLAALKSEMVRLTTALEESERQRAAEVAERVTAQSFLKAAQQRSERAEHELQELREKQKRIPELEKEGQELSKRLQIASELAEKAKARVAILDAELAETTRDNETKEKELIELRTKRAELERDLQRAADRAERHEQSAAELNEELGRLEAIKAEAEKLRQNLERTTEARGTAEERIAELEAALGQAEQARKDLAKQLTDSKSALASTSQERESLYNDALKSWEKLEEIEKARTNLAREREALRTTNDGNLQRVQELEAVRTALEGQRKEQAQAIEQLGGQVTALEAQRQQLHEELERIRGDSGKAVTDLREQLEKVDRDRTVLSEQIAALKLVEEERERLATRVEELESESAAARRASEQLEIKLQELGKQAQRVENERAALQVRIEKLAESEQNLAREKGEQISQTRAELERMRAELSEREAALEASRQEFQSLLSNERNKADTSIDALRKQLEDVQEQRQGIEKELRAARDDEAVRDELLATAAQEQKVLAEQVAAAAEERQKLTANLDELRAQLKESTAGKSEAEKRIAEIEEALRVLRDEELAESRLELEKVLEERASLSEALEAAQERHSLEIVDLQDQLTLARQEQEQMSQALAEKDHLLQSAEHGLTTLELEENGEDDLPLEIDRSGGSEADEDSAAAVQEPVAARADEIVILDLEPFVSAAAQLLSETGHRVLSFKPEPESATELAQAAFACAAINLAAPAAWPTLRKIRNGAGVPHTPMIAYALSENAKKGFWLGPVDFVTLPIGDTDLNKLLSTMVPNLRRVIAMSHDFDVMEQVRAQLTGARISTAIVLDGRQALDLVPTVKPQAAVLHMSPNCADVFRAVAGLRSQEETREIPILFLLDHEAQPREESFVTAGIRMLSGRGTLAPDTLPKSLVNAFESFQH